MKIFSNTFSITEISEEAISSEASRADQTTESRRSLQNERDQQVVPCGIEDSNP